MKKTVDEKFRQWFRKSFANGTWICKGAQQLACNYGYTAGHKSAAIELNKKIRKQDDVIDGLRETVIMLVEACERLAGEAAKADAKVDALAKSVEEWEASEWKFLEVGDIVKFVYGEASLGIWKKVK